MDTLPHTPRCVSFIVLVVYLLAGCSVTSTHPAAENTATSAAIADESSTGIPADGVYDWRGAKLSLADPLPSVPNEANVYRLQSEQPATVEEVRVLAQQFGVRGEVYLAPEVFHGPDKQSYMVTDGRQRLYVRSQNDFSYYADYNTEVEVPDGKTISEEQAYAAIDTFLKSHGFNFAYQIEQGYRDVGAYYVVPQTVDGHAIRYNYMLPACLGFIVGDNGQIILVWSNRVHYEPVGVYGIRTAKEAFQQLLDPLQTTQVGMQESVRPGGFWSESSSRSYLDSETITLYGFVAKYDPVDPGGSAFVCIAVSLQDCRYTVTGQIPSSSGILVEATGYFYKDNGIRKFEVESWREAPEAFEMSIAGRLRQEGEEIILQTPDGQEYTLPQAPADILLNADSPAEQFTVFFVVINDKLEWTSIRYKRASSHSLGRERYEGSGFRELDLGGTPVASPTVTDAGQTDSQNPYIGMHLADHRGMVMINIYQSPDGTQRTEYTFVDRLLYLILEGDGLKGLEKFHSRPVNIWGTIERTNEQGNMILEVDHFEIPFPDLQFQILRGKQRNIQIQGQPTILFETNSGASYVQLTHSGDFDSSPIGGEDDEVLLEALIIPDESVDNYPALRGFSSALAVDPQSGQVMQLTITADQPYVMPEVEAAVTEIAAPLNAIIEKVDLVYYIADPRAAVSNPSLDTPYIQPAWRFYGHYENGDEFEFLVQALRDDYLLP